MPQGVVVYGAAQMSFGKMAKQILKDTKPKNALTI